MRESVQNTKVISVNHRSQFNRHDLCFGVRFSESTLELHIEGLKYYNRGTVILTSMAHEANCTDPKKSILGSPRDGQVPPEASCRVLPHTIQCTVIVYLHQENPPA